MTLAVVNETDKYLDGFTASLASDAISFTAGNLSVVSVAWGEDESFPSNNIALIDSAGNIYTPVDATFDWGSQVKLRQWYCADIIGNVANVVTATFDGAFGAFRPAIIVQQISRAALTSVLSGNNSGSILFGGSLATGIITVDGNCIIIAIAYNPFNSLVAGSGYTGALTVGTPNVMYEYKLVSVSEAASATGAEAGWGMIGAAFKEADEPPPIVVTSGYVTSLSFGPQTALTQNTEYALPVRAGLIHSTAALEISIDRITWTALTNADTTGTKVAGGFIRCPGGDAVVTLRRFRGF